MNNLICIVAGEPNSVNSELIAKVWKKKEKFKKNQYSYNRKLFID